MLFKDVWHCGYFKLGACFKVCLLQGPLEGVFPSASVDVKDVSSEDDGVSFSELGIRAGVYCSVATRVTVLNPNGR